MKQEKERELERNKTQKKKNDKEENNTHIRKNISRTTKNKEKYGIVDNTNKKNQEKENGKRGTERTRGSK